VPAHRFSRGDLNQHLDINSEDAIGTVAKTFTGMQASLEVAFNRVMKKSGR